MWTCRKNSSLSMKYYRRWCHDAMMPVKLILFILFLSISGFRCFSFCNVQLYRYQRDYLPYCELKSNLRLAHLLNVKIKDSDVNRKTSDSTVGFLQPPQYPLSSIFTILSAAAIAISYADRSNLSTAMWEITMRISYSCYRTSRS